MVLYPDDVAPLDFTGMDIEDHFAQRTVPILAGPAGSTAIRVSVNKVGFQFGGTLSTVTKLPILGVA